MYYVRYIVVGIYIAVPLCSTPSLACVMKYTVKNPATATEESQKILCHQWRSRRNFRPCTLHSFRYSLRTAAAVADGGGCLDGGGGGGGGGGGACCWRLRSICFLSRLGT